MSKLLNIGAKARLVALMAVLLFVLFAPTVFGQTTDPIRYLVAPETPGPNALVVLEVEGVGGFLGNAEITWTLDGKVAKSGVGERSFSFTTGGLGTRSTVRVSVDSATQGSFSKTFTFAPSLINLVWEADTTVPLLYPGKALYSAGSPLKIVAFPVVYSGSSRVSSSALTFDWFRNEEPLTSQSGRGRSVLSITGDQIQAEEIISVNVYHGSAKVGRSEMVIPAIDTQVVLYERSGLRGTLYDVAFPSTIQLVGQEITIEAQPYYFSAPAYRNGLLRYSWTLGNDAISGPDSARGVLTLRQAGTGAGGSALAVEIQNNSSDQLVQAATRAIQILFGQSSANFFGL